VPLPQVLTLQTCNVNWQLVEVQVQWCRNTMSHVLPVQPAWVHFDAAYAGAAVATTTAGTVQARAGGDVKIRVLRAGLCGTDLHLEATGTTGPRRR
jgi:hypothetical protein